MDVDRVARRLAHWGRTARRLPPALFAREAVTYPLLTSRGAHVGKLVPGGGIAIDADLRMLGITRPVPGVIERSRWMRSLERLSSDRGAITSMADIRAAMDSQREVVNHQEAFTSVGPTGWVEYFDVTNPSNSGAAIAPTRANLAGAFNAQMTDPPAGATKYFIGISTLANGVAHGGAIYVDVCSAIGNINGATTSTHSFTTAALTRYTSGAGVYPTLWCQSGSGINLAGPSTYTFSYTNQAGVSGQLGNVLSIGATGSEVLTNGADGEVPLATFADGDYGCQSVQSLTASVASTASPSNILLLLVRPLVWLDPVEEASVTCMIDVASDPSMLVPFATDGSGVLGFHTVLAYAPLSGSGTTVTFSIDTIWS